MGMRAAFEGRLQHVGEAQISDEVACACEQGLVFKPFDGVADVSGFCHSLGRFAHGSNEHSRLANDRVYAAVAPSVHQENNAAPFPTGDSRLRLGHIHFF